MTALTVADIEAGYEHDSHDGCDGFLGFGYLGGRLSAESAASAGEWPGGPTLAAIAAADEAALAIANAKRWNRERLFTWLNSKDGRWYADEVLGSGADPAKVASRYVR